MIITFANLLAAEEEGVFNPRYRKIPKKTHKDKYELIYPCQNTTCLRVYKKELEQNDTYVIGILSPPELFWMTNITQTGLRLTMNDPINKDDINKIINCICKQLGLHGGKYNVFAAQDMLKLLKIYKQYVKDKYIAVACVCYKGDTFLPDEIVKYICKMANLSCIENKIKPKS